MFRDAGLVSPSKAHADPGSHAPAACVPNASGVFRNGSSAAAPHAGVRHRACVHSDSPVLDSKVPCSLGVALTMLVVVRSSLLPVVMVM